MAHSVVDHVGQTSSPSITGSVNRTVIGPPVSGAKNYQGVFAYQSGSGGSQTFRWIHDDYIGTTASPTTYTFDPQHRS